MVSGDRTTEVTPFNFSPFTWLDGPTPMKLPWRLIVAVRHAVDMRILFVCLGNICRSPTAEAVMLGLVEKAGLSGRIEIDSAGTGSWHVGNLADPRAIAAAAQRGVELTSRARQVTVTDFDEFDLIVAMDRSNFEDLVEMPGADPSKVKLLRGYSGDADTDVPDPYYGGDDGFEEVLDIVDRNCRVLLEEISASI